MLSNLGPGSSFIIALDRDGKLAWARRSNIDFSRATQSGGSDLLVAGSAENGDLVVQRWGADGNLLQDHRWSCRAQVAGLAATPDDGFVLAANLHRPCVQAGQTLDQGALIVGLGRGGPGLLEFWKGLAVIDLDVAPDGDVVVARKNRVGDHSLLRLGEDARIRWSVAVAPRRAVRVEVDPVGRTFLATDADVTAWTAKGGARWSSAEPGIASLAAGRGWVAHTGPGGRVSMMNAIDGEVLLDGGDSRLTAGPVAATADDDLIVALSSVHEVAWESGGPVARGSSGKARVTIVRLEN